MSVIKLDIKKKLSFITYNKFVRIINDFNILELDI
jgi:hypothetical protein